MRKLKNTLTLLFIISGINAWAQTPAISNIERPISFPRSRVLITGSGFSANPAQLQVWFDHVKGQIISSTAFSIEAEVPVAARFSSVTVVNLSSKLSARSGMKYMPSFSGEGFDPSKLETPISLTSPKPVFDLISADIDGDNKPDLLGTTDNLVGATNSTSIRLHLNQSTPGNLSFATNDIASLNLNAPSGFINAGDLNGDGKPDLVVSRSGNTNNTLFVLGNNSTAGNPVFATPIVLSLDATHTAREVFIADFNADGKADILVSNSKSSDLYIFKNESSGGTININTTPIKVTVTGAQETLSLDIQDYDGDNDLDIAATKNQTPDLFILKNEGSFTFTTTKITAAGSFNDLNSADFNRDGKLDLITTSLFSSQVQIFINQSSGSAITFAAFPISIATDAQPFGIDVSDLNGDTFPDFIVACRGTTTLNAFIHKGATGPPDFNKTIINTSKTNWYVKASDLDGDGKPDIAFTSFNNSSNFTIDVLRNKNCHKPKILNQLPLAICASQTIRLNAIPLPGITFDWSNGFSSIKNSTDPFADVTAAATYTVKATSEGGACAVNSEPVTIQSGAGSLPTDPVITANTPICTGGQLLLSTTAVTNATYQWSGPNGFTSTAQNPPAINNVTSANAGNYTLVVKIGDCASNLATKTIDIASFGSFTVTSSVAGNSICQGQPLTLSVNAETGYSYQWIKDGANISGQTTTNLSVTQEGVYKVRITNTAISCSQETSPLNITVFSAPTASFDFTPAKVCVGSLVTFKNTTTNKDTRATTNYAWDFGDTKTSTLENPTNQYTTANTYNVKLTVSYAGVAGCSSTKTTSLAVSDATAPVIQSTATELCDGETATLSVTGTFNTYLWNDNSNAATLEVTKAGDYSVTTQDVNGCSGTASITVGLKTSGCSTELIFPPAFSPNGDSTNDRWVVSGVETKTDCTMNIYDGRGRKIFQVTGYPANGWDGTFEGKEVPQGTYYYVFGCPDKKPITGSVLIIK